MVIRDNGVRRAGREPASGKSARLPVNTDLRWYPGGNGFQMYIAATFLQRFMGVWGLAEQDNDQILCLIGCRAIHTFGLNNAMDIVFLDSQDHELHRITSLPPNRCAWLLRAVNVVELPAAYCQRHPDYLCRIRQALQCYRTGQAQSCQG